MLRNVLFISLEIVGAYEDILTGDGIKSKRPRATSVFLRTLLYSQSGKSLVQHWDADTSNNSIIRHCKVSQVLVIGVCHTVVPEIKHHNRECVRDSEH